MQPQEETLETENEPYDYETWSAKASFERITANMQKPTEFMHKDDTLGTLYERGRPEHLLTFDDALRKMSFELKNQERIIYAEFDAMKFGSVCYYVGLTVSQALERFNKINFIAKHDCDYELEEQGLLVMKMMFLQIAINVDAWAFMTVSEINTKTKEIKVIEKPNGTILLVANKYLNAGEISWLGSD